jgi:hypothetical protein
VQTLQSVAAAHHGISLMGASSLSSLVPLDWHVKLHRFNVSAPATTAVAERVVCRIQPILHGVPVQGLDRIMQIVLTGAGEGARPDNIEVIITDWTTVSATICGLLHTTHLTWGACTGVRPLFMQVLVIGAGQGARPDHIWLNYYCYYCTTLVNCPRTVCSGTYFPGIAYGFATDHILVSCVHGACSSQVT